MNGTKIKIIKHRDDLKTKFVYLEGEKKGKNHNTWTKYVKYCDSHGKVHDVKLPEKEPEPNHVYKSEINTLERILQLDQPYF